MKPIKNLSDLLGLVLDEIQHDKEEVVFYFHDGNKVRMYHEQDCCESVEIVDVDGNFDDLVGGVVTDFSERSSENLSVFDQIAITARGLNDDSSESSTWTFYHIVTNKGSIVIRWLGESNGYYSETVSIKVPDDDAYGGWRAIN